MAGLGREAAGPRVRGGHGAPRTRWVDNLRVALIAGVIVVHAATTYVVAADWYYEELTTSTLTPLLLSFPVLLAAIVGLGPLFLVAGSLAAGSLARHGPRAFVRGRLLRLGVPLVGYTLVLDPLTDYLGARHDPARGTLVDYLSGRTGTRDMGPLWFVSALLVFSIGYAGWRALRPARPAPTGALSPVRLAQAAGAITVGSFVVWLWVPIGGQTELNAHWPHWPQAAVLFGLGVAAGERGWLQTMPLRFARRCGHVAAAAVLGLAALSGVAVAADDIGALTGGWQVETVAFALLGAVVSVTMPWWLIGWFRRRADRQGPLLARAARGSYAAYLVHPPVLVLLALALRPLALPPEVSFVGVAALGLAASFAAGYLLTRVPVVDRVL